ncbi:MAG: tetratricopeptide repeat protein [Sphingorhabdus sp.]
MAMPSWASDTILFQPVPEWVDQVDLETVLAAKPNSNNFLVVLDRQTKMEDGTEWNYADVVVRGQTAEFLGEVAKLLNASWQPDRGDLVIHRLEILRSGQVINALEKGSKFEVIRQEKGLNNQQINGILTATTQIEDLQLGDIIRFSATTSARNPVLAGRTETAAGLATHQIETDFDRFRLIWPETDAINYKALGKDINPVVTTKNGYSVLTMSALAPKQPDFPKDAPNRFKTFPAVITSGFASWSEVSKTAALQYQAKGLIPQGSELDREVKSIMATSQDPVQRAALALRLVQDKVRYLYNGLGYGNYQPQTPLETWRLRYGDCKAKTLLLLAMLDELGVAAEPMLVSVNGQDSVTNLLPTFLAFDHIIVRAVVDDQTLWLDGTGSGTRMIDLKDAPPHRYGLPLRPEGGDLQPIVMNKPGRPYQDVDLGYDASAGLALPAFFDLELKLRDGDAAELRASQSQAKPEAFKETLDKLVSKYVVEALVLESSLAFDDEASHAVIRAKGLSYLGWTRKNGKFEHDIWSVIDSKKLESDRKKVEWRSIPVDTGDSGYYRENTRFKLPDAGSGFALEGQSELKDNLAGFDLDRITTLSGDIVNFREEYFLAKPEIPADQIATEARKLTRVQNNGIKILAPANYPEKWQVMKAAIAAKKIEPFKKAYDQIVANAPKEELGYRQRAFFYELIGDYDQAARDLAEAIKLEPTADKMQWRATLLRGSDERAAITVLQDALKLEPAHDASVRELIDIYNLSKRPGAALKVVDEAFAAGLDDDSAQVYRAEINLAENNPDEAIAKLDLLIEDKPESAYLLGTRCWYKALGNVQLESALEDCTKSIQLSENPSDKLDSRGSVYMRMGKYREAIADFDAALKIAPDYASALYQRSIAYAKTGQVEESANSLAAAIYADKDIARTFNFYGIEK